MYQSAMPLLSRPRIPTSSVMPCDEARQIVATFAENMLQLADFQRQQLRQPRNNEPLLWSLPVEQLKHSKWQIQIAFAIAVADLVVRSRVERSEQVRHLLIVTSRGCAELGWFTCKPAFVPLQKSDPPGLLSCDDADWKYAWWKGLCERCFDAGAGEPRPEMVWPSEQALIQYWHDVDFNLSLLLNENVLRETRAT